MPTAREGLAAATGPDGRIYAIGGAINYGSTVLSTVEAYTPATNTWSTVAPLPTPRAWLAAAEGSDGLIYAMGGITSNSYNTSAVVEAYNTKTNVWTELPSMPTARSHLGATAGLSNGMVYALGGDSPTGTTDVVEAFNTKTKTWSEETPMPEDRSDMAVRSLHGLIYVVAGFCQSCFYGLDIPIKLVEIYSPITNAWTTGPSYLAPRADLAAAYGPDGRLYGIGGIDARDNPTTSVYEFTP
jgi:N-acetylneuraminic acid mutarotase